MPEIKNIIIEMKNASVVWRRLRKKNSETGDRTVEASQTEKQRGKEN